LHLHSSASDGECAPADVPRRARAAGLDVIALTDHDTLAGVETASRTGDDIGVTVIAGCEFSVAADWGEMHLLAYYLPAGHAELDGFLERQRGERVARGQGRDRFQNRRRHRCQRDRGLRVQRRGGLG